MTRAEAIAKITTSLPRLSDEHLQLLADIAQSWSVGAAEPLDDDATRAAIANGIAQGRRGEFASDDEVAAAYARFRK
jgi:predicted transcriptional regulator